MGHCYSCMPDTRPVSLEAAEEQLDEGDLVWVAGAGKATYMMKTSTWVSFTRVGFVVRTGPGPSGLHVLLAPPLAYGSSDGEARFCDSGAVELVSLGEELTRACTKQVGFTAIHPKLQQIERERLQEYAKLTVGKSGFSKRVTLLVSRGRKKVLCSMLVAEMLETIGRVGRTVDYYGPTTRCQACLHLGPLYYIATNSQGWGFGGPGVNCVNLEEEAQQGYTPCPSPGQACPLPSHSKVEAHSKHSMGTDTTQCSDRRQTPDGVLSATASSSNPLYNGQQGHQQTGQSIMMSAEDLSSPPGHVLKAQRLSPSLSAEREKRSSKPRSKSTTVRSLKLPDTEPSRVAA